MLARKRRKAKSVRPANINSPSQIVIAGNAEAVDRAIEMLKEKGAKRAIKLNVSAPFHCDLMLPAQERLAQDLAELSYRICDFRLLKMFRRKRIRAAKESETALTEQVSSPVRWSQIGRNFDRTTVWKHLSRSAREKFYQVWSDRSIVMFDV